MLESIVNPLKNFRDKIYHFFSSRSDASFELVDSLSSNTRARSVVELSLNAVHRRNYCSITRVLGEFYPLNTDKKSKHDELTTIIAEECIPADTRKRNYHLLGVDCTPNARRYAPTQEDRGFVYAPNTIAGNKPVTIGHQYSVMALLPEKEDKNSPPWIVPLSCHRVATNEKGTLLGMQQISACINSQDKFKNSLCVSVGDSAYSNADAIFESSKNKNQVHISRLRSNRVLYCLAEESHAKKRGRKKRYGDPFRLNDSNTHREPDETKEFETITKKGKKYTVKITSWNNLIMRGKHKANISDCSVRLIRVCVYKESGESLFKKPLWLSVVGERRFELSLQDIFDCYRQRFDIEHFFRFGKNKMLLDKSQTPELAHEEAWWQICMMAYVQLYLARKLANNVPTPWGKYLKSEVGMSPTKVQKDFDRIIQTIGTPAKAPKRRKKAPGRQKGDTQPKRMRHEIVMKQKTAQPIAVSP